MKLFDVNILVYAHRQDQTHHEFFRSRLESLINGPTPLSQALSVIESLASLPNCCWVNPGTRHWPLLAELCRAAQCSGKRVSDAQEFTAFTGHGLRLELLKP